MGSGTMVAGLHLPSVDAGAGPAPEIADPFVAQAAATGARIVLLPELFAWPFYCADDPIRWRHAAEPLDGASVAWAQGRADALDLVLLVPFPLAVGADGVRNVVALVRPGRPAVLLAEKIHLSPRAGAGWGEEDHFIPAPPRLRAVRVAGLILAVAICFDRRFPATWQAARRAGADLLCCPIAGPTDDPPDFFLAELRTHARETGIAALTAGRSGHESLPGAAPLTHDAPSALVGACGSTLDWRPAGATPGIVSGTLSHAAIQHERQCRPHFELRRVIGHEFSETGE